MGVATEKRLEKLLEGGHKGGIPESAVKKVSTVTEDTILEDLFSIVTENPYPIPVCG